MLELKRENDMKRKAILESLNSEIQASVRKLNLEGDKLSAEEKSALESKITEDKAKLNELLSQ
jgi:hypothetical protein